jgi:hypothetical protein
MLEYCVFHLGGKLVAPFIAMPNADKCNRRQTRKDNRARLYATWVILMQNEYCPFANNLDKVLVHITL